MVSRRRTLAELSQQISSLTTLVYDSATTLLNDSVSWVLGLPSKAKPVPSHSLILVTGSGNGLSRSLAIYLASVGYTVMLQTPFSGQVSPLMARWSEVKKITASTGALVPLTFSSRSAESRAHAFKTLTAFARDNDLSLCAIINCVDARGMRSGNLPYADVITGKRSSDSLSSDLVQQEQQRGGLKKRKVSLGDSAEVFYQETPIPLGIATEEHLRDLHNEILGVIGVVQDALPQLRSNKGRVINVWASGAPIGFGPVPTGPLSMTESAFKAASATMALELAAFDVSVSIVLPGTTLLEDQGGVTERIEAIPPTISVTNDVRSILSPSSSAAIRSVFDSQIKFYRRAITLSAYFSVDERALWRVVRRTVEAKFPKQIVPVGMDMILCGMAHAILPNQLMAAFETFVWQRARNSR